MRDRRQIAGEVLLIGVTLIWGATFSVTRAGLVHISPLLLVAIRFLGSFAVVWPVLYARGYRFRGVLVPGIVLGLLLSVGYSLQTIGLMYTTAARSAFVTYLFAVFVPPLQKLITDRTLSLGNLFGLAIVLVGTAVLTRPWTAGGWNTGDLLTLGAAVAFAFFVVLIDRFSRRHDPVLFVPAEFATAGCIALLVAVIFSLAGTEAVKFEPGRELILAIAFLSLIGTVGALGIQTVFQSRTSPVRATTIYALEPVFAALFGRLILEERMSAIEVTGAAIIICGVLVSQLAGELQWPRRSGRAPRRSQH